MIAIITYDDRDSNHPTAVMVDKIVRLAKTGDGRYTLIYLTTGDILYSTDSMKTLVARIEGSAE